MASGDWLTCRMTVGGAAGGDDVTVTVVVAVAIS